MNKFQDLIDANDEALLADGFDDAYVGCIHPGIAVYDRAKCIEILVAQGMDDLEAEDYFSFNTECAYVGPYTPVFLIRPVVD